MENPRKRTTVTMAPGSDGLRAVDHQQQQAYARLPNVTRRQMLTGLATAGVALAQTPLVASVTAQAMPPCPPPAPPFTYFFNGNKVIENLVVNSAAPIQFKKPNQQI